jgi:hypothetical protein
MRIAAVGAMLRRDIWGVVGAGAGFAAGAMLAQGETSVALLCFLASFFAFRRARG